MPKGLVHHPRFGARPRITGVDERTLPNCHRSMWLYSSGSETVIPYTGILADPARQRGTSMPHSVYYDVLKVCSTCRRPFIFFAEEQLYWYETLGILIFARGDNCVECRKELQADEKVHYEYQRLLEKEDKDTEDYFALATAAMELYARDRFHNFQRVRQFLNKIPETHRKDARFTQLKKALRAAEQACAAKKNARGA